VDANMGWVIFIGIIILIAIFMSSGFGGVIIALFVIGFISFGIYKIWKHFDNKQWDKWAAEKISSAINIASALESNPNVAARAKSAIRKANEAKSLSAYEAYKAAETALELAQEASKLKSTPLDQQETALRKISAETEAKRLSEYGIASPLAFALHEKGYKIGYIDSISDYNSTSKVFEVSKVGSSVGKVAYNTYSHANVLDAYRNDVIMRKSGIVGARENSTGTIIAVSTAQYDNWLTVCDSVF
jgi:hypothetical protein